MLRTDPIASSKEAAVKPIEQHNPQPAPAAVPSEQRPAHALSGLQDLSSSRGRSRGAPDGTTGAEKRPLSPDASSATQAPAKKSRSRAELPSPTGVSASHGTDRPFGADTDGQRLSRTEGIQAVTFSHSEAAQMGGKVVDVPNLPTLHGQPENWAPTQIDKMKHTIETELTEKHGHPVKVLGYHVTPEQNVESLRTEGFSAEKHQGKAGGVAGINIHGPGLYISDHPTSDYARADGHDRMFAVVVPGTGFRKSDERPTAAWESTQHHPNADAGQLHGKHAGRTQDPANRNR
jgi:hypothetical protein